MSECKVGVEPHEASEAASVLEASVVEGASPVASAPASREPPSGVAASGVAGASLPASLEVGESAFMLPSEVGESFADIASAASDAAASPAPELDPLSVPPLGTPEFEDDELHP